jgi:hypothetical protein
MATINPKTMTIIVVIVIIAGIGGYFLLLSKSSFQAPKPVNTTFTTLESTTVTSINTTSQVYTSSIVPTGNGSFGSYRAFEGKFNYTMPVGPSGGREQGSGIALYNSVQTVSGNFSFTVNYSAPNSPGVGKGFGSANIIVSGFCQGSNSTAYIFPINTMLITPNESNPNESNLSIVFGIAKPQKSTVDLSCTDVNNNPYSSIGNYNYSSVYPNTILLNQSGGEVSAKLPGNVSYNITVIGG